MTPKIKTMFEHAIAKWQWIVDNWDYDKPQDYNIERMYKELPFLRQYETDCSFCEEFNSEDNSFHCEGCPIKEAGNWCCNADTFFRIWIDAITNFFVSIQMIEDAKQAALNLLNLIKKLNFNYKEQ